jgi:hypothetical protein
VIVIGAGAISTAGPGPSVTGEELEWAMATCAGATAGCGRKTFDSMTATANTPAAINKMARTTFGLIVILF